MSLEITIQPRKIIRNVETKKLLEAYKDVLKETKLSIQTDEPIDRTGLLARYVKKTIEILSHEEYGATYSCLQKENYSIDFASETLFRWYLSYINDLFKYSGFDETDTDKEELDSKYTVAYEIIYRLAVIALSKEAYESNDKDSLTNALAKFIDHKVFTELFVTKQYGIIGNPTATLFLASLRNENGKWMARFREMVDKNYLLHLNKIAISNTLNTLTHIEQKIEGFLIVCLDPNQHKATLGVRRLNDTLRLCENKYLPKIENSEIALVDKNPNNVRSLEQENTIIAKLTERNEILGNKTRELYHAYREIRKLRQLLIHLDSFIDYTSWVAILYNTFDFNKLADLIQDKFEKTQEILQFGNDLKYLLQKSAGLGLIQLSNINWQKIIVKNIGEIRHLGEIELKQYITDTVYTNFVNLLNAQNEFDERFRFINIEQLKRANLLVFQETTNNAMAIEFQKLKAENDKLKRENQLLITDQGSQFANIKNLTEDNEALKEQTELQRLKQENIVLRQEIESLKETIVILEEQITSYDKDLEDYNTTSNQNINRLTAQTNVTINTLTEEMNYLRRKNRDLKRTLILSLNKIVRVTTLNSYFNRFMGSSSATENLFRALANKSKDVNLYNRYIEQGAEINLPCRILNLNDYQGYYPLHIAAETGNIIACLWLLKQNTEDSFSFVNRKDLNKNENALDKASIKGHLTVITLLQKEGALSTLINKATLDLHNKINDRNIIADEKIQNASEATHEHKKELLKLITHGALINDRDKDVNQLSNTPLHKLIVLGNQLLLLLIINAGADLTKKNRDKLTPLEYLRKTKTGDALKDTEDFLHQFCPEIYVEPTSIPMLNTFHPQQRSQRSSFNLFNWFQTNIKPDVTYRPWF